jgi:hypothetical protein
MVYSDDNRCQSLVLIIIVIIRIGNWSRNHHKLSMCEAWTYDTSVSVVGTVSGEFKEYEEAGHRENLKAGKKKKK